MFEFDGCLSEKCINKTSKRQNQYIAIAFAFFNIPLTIIAILIFVFQKNYEILILCILSVFINISLLFIPAKSIIFRMPRVITFDLQNDLITIKLEGIDNNKIKPQKKYISKIKKIIDEDEWYFIIFKGDITNNIVCQKNLLKTGTIKEFEEIFKSKIIKQKK